MEDPKVCCDIRVELTALVAGELDEEGRAAVERHLSFCQGCRFEWGANELVWRCLSRCEGVDPPAELRKRLFEAIAQNGRTRRTEPL